MKDNSQKYGLVLCEGQSDVDVLKKITPEQNSSKLRYKPYEGKNKLQAFLDTTSNSSDYTNGQIQKILVTRDADENWESAWQSACEAVQNIFKVKAPTEPGKWQQIKNGPLITVWIAPGKKEEGMIETLYLKAAKSSECLETYVECLKTKDAIELHEKERFDIWTITAQGRGPAKGHKRLPFADALKRLSLDWNSSVFSEIKDLLAKTGEF